MRLEIEEGCILVRVEVNDTVDRVGKCIDMLTGSRCDEHVTEGNAEYRIRVQPHDDRQMFTIVIPKMGCGDPDLLALCAAYIAQQASPD